ncbi:hypothetical protein M1D48_12125 [Erwinia sp. D4-22]
MTTVTPALTQNITAVIIGGPTLTAPLNSGGFIVATVGGTVYTLGIKSVENEASLKLT